MEKHKNKYFIPQELLESLSYPAIFKKNKMGLWNKNGMRWVWFSNPEKALNRFGYYAYRTNNNYYFKCYEIL